MNVDTYRAIASLCKTGPQTVYPTTAGGFPPASFREQFDAHMYIRQMQIEGTPCGLAMCPASSYDKLYPDTTRPAN